MARIVGVDIPRNKKIAFSLCYIHGIGLSTALKICEKAKVDTAKRVQELTEKQISKVREIISSLEINVEGGQYINFILDFIFFFEKEMTLLSEFKVFKTPYIFQFAMKYIYLFVI